jgi:lysyl-tRNA synthetase class 1
VTGIDLDEGVVEYECTDVEAGDQTIDGCGHEGTASLRDGKLPWRFEWPAQWQVLGVDFEPFGKDHAEGSWPSGSDVARNVLGDEPPVPMVYEWFTLEGQPFSSSEGHVVLVQDVLRPLEPEVVRFFFSKDPQRARDFSIERLDQLVDEFDRMEAVYFGELDVDEDERERAERVYPLLVDELREDRIRIPYTFAAVLGMTDDPALREEIARREGHIPDDAPEWAVQAALERVERAREWARRTDNEFNYDLKRREIPDYDFDESTVAALDDLADFVAAEDPDGDELQGEIYESAKRHDVDIGAFFSAGYRLFFDEDQGPKLGPFLAKLDDEFVLQRLRRNE